ncbi:hypothetical protein AVEN_22441-1 [Araneus ventricosus]|uniref:RNase H type-1 domain-containing protein n=1 Tax=Araneus ventricosus TaxID=182803 RepID=A0A4Y2LMX7_ARAVE|nr:hypothetical protein AVEN_22441-1 [Araneus ventricosus]
MNDSILDRQPFECNGKCLILILIRHQLVRDIQSLFTQNRNILVRWIKAHAGYRGNEEVDTLAKKAITEGVVMKALNPICELKQHLQELFLKKKWQNLWYNGNTGCSVHKVLKTVHLKPVFWTREEILFVTGHCPFPSFLNRFHLSESDSCSCEEVGDPIHYATSCPLILYLEYSETFYFTGKSVGPKSPGESEFEKNNNKHD